MRHQNTNRKFGRERGQRKALRRSLVRALIMEGKICTSLAKAQELRPIVEKLVTRAKDSSVHNRRILQSRTGNADIAARLISHIAPKYKNRKGGYTRIMKFSGKRGDASPQAFIEFV